MENSRKGRKFLIFAGKKCIRMAVLPSAGQRSHLLAGVHIAPGSPFSECRTGGSGKHEPGADCKASGILGGRSSAGEAFPFLVWGFASWRLGNVFAVPPPGAGGDSDKAGKLSVAYGGVLAPVRTGGIPSGNCSRIPEGKRCGQGDFRVCSCNSQYADLLAGPGVLMVLLCG